MKRQTQVKKNLQSKKVAVFSKSNLAIVAAWLRPGDKLKYDDKDAGDYYLDIFGEIPYKKVFVNGQEGFIIAEAINVQ